MSRDAPVLFSEFDYENELLYAHTLGRGDFHRQRTRLATAEAVTIAVDRGNFHKLPRIVARALAARPGGDTAPAEALPRFELDPLADLHLRFAAHLEALAGLPPLGEVRFSFELHDGELLAYLEQAAEASLSFDQKAVRLAMGVVSDAVFTGPYRILIDPTTTCNLDCVYCRAFSPLVHHNVAPEHRRTHLGLDLFRQLIRQAAELDVRQVSLVGGAEPTSVPHFDAIVEELGRANLPTDISTNGTLLGAGRRAELMVDSGVFHSITFSISAASGEVYELVHPRSAKLWPRLLRNAETIARRRAERGTGQPTLIYLFALLNTNFHEIEDAVRLAARLGFDSIWFQLLHAEQWSRHLALTPEQRAELPEVLGRAEALARELGLGWETYIAAQAEHLDDGEEAAWSDFMYRQGCLVGWYFSYVSYNGELNFCCGAKEVERLGRTTAGGSALDYAGAWGSDRYRFFRQSAKFLSDRVNIHCRNHHLLSDAFCRSCDNHNFDAEVRQMLAQTGLGRFLRRDAGLQRAFLGDFAGAPDAPLPPVTSPVTLERLEVVDGALPDEEAGETAEAGAVTVQSGAPLTVRVRYRASRPALHHRLRLRLTLTQFHEVTVSRVELPLGAEAHAPGEAGTLDVTIERFLAGGTAPLALRADVAFREGELDRYYEGSGLRLPLRPRFDPRHGGGLVPLPHRWQVERHLPDDAPFQAPAESALVEGFGLTLRDGEGRAVEALQRDAPATLEFALTALWPLARPCFRVQLYLLDPRQETFLFGSHTERHGLELPELWGPITLRLEIPRLALVAGAYFCTFELFDGTPEGERLYRAPNQPLRVEGPDEGGDYLPLRFTARRG